MRTFLLSLSVLLVMAATSNPSAAAEDKSDPNAEWRVLGNGAEAQHHSPLKQVNDKSVTKLGLAWVAEIPSPDGLSGNPLVANGIVYQSGPQGRVYANDLRTGASVWTFDAHTKFTRDTHVIAYVTSRINRGLALLDDKVFVASGDCHLYALDQKTGKLLWDVMSCDPKEAYGITGAPRVGGGLVFIGNACGDSGLTRGFVDAFDAATGKRKWRFYTVPGDPAKPPENELMKKAAATWGTDWYSKTHGCGSVWEAMTYDATTGILYIGVAGPAPWSPAMRAADAGDELFTNSIVALKAQTGEYVWHFKQVPNDAWNFDATMHIMLADLGVDGKPQRVVMQAPKNGFFYVLDARTGEFISAQDYLPQNWALKIDAKSGRPTPNPEAQYWKHPGERSIVSPGAARVSQLAGDGIQSRHGPGLFPRIRDSHADAAGPEVTGGRHAVRHVLRAARRSQMASRRLSLCLGSRRTEGALAREAGDADEWRRHVHRRQSGVSRPGRRSFQRLLG